MVATDKPRGLSRNQACRSLISDVSLQPREKPVLLPRPRPVALAPGSPGEQGQGCTEGGTPIAFKARGWQFRCFLPSPTLSSPSGLPSSLSIQFETPRFWCLEQIG